MLCPAALVPSLLTGGVCGLDLGRWLHNGFPLLVLPGHSAMISRVMFVDGVNEDLSHSLISTGHDGTTRVWG